MYYVANLFFGLIALNILHTNLPKYFILLCLKFAALSLVLKVYIYTKVQGKYRVFVKCATEQLGLEGSYIPQTYIEQIQLEKLVNEVTVLPDDLKTKLSIDDEVVSSPRKALSPASTDIAMRKKNLKSWCPKVGREKQQFTSRQSVA